MGIFDKLIKRIGRDNSGGWDQDYKKYIRKSIMDQILPTPIGKKSFALSHRRYHFPLHVLKNLNYKFGLISDTGGIPEISAIKPSHTLYGILQILEVYDLKFGLLVKFDSIKDWEGLNLKDREFTISFRPVGYNYTLIGEAINSTRYSRASRPPRFIYVDENGIHEEGPEFLHVKKQDIFLPANFQWPQTFSLRIQGNSPKDFGYGRDWTNESAYND